MPRNSVGIDRNGDGIIDKLVTLRYTVVYGRTYNIKFEDIDGYTKRFNSYDLLIDHNVISDRSVQVSALIDMIAYTRNFYCQFKATDYLGYDMAANIEPIQVRYNESTDVRIPEIDGYRINTALYNSDIGYPAVRVEINQDKPDAVYAATDVAIHGAYCIDTIGAVVSYITADNRDGVYKTRCYIWYNRGEALDDVTLTVTDNVGELNNTYSINGVRGLAELVLDTNEQGPTDYSGRTITFTFVDNSDPERTLTIQYDVPSNYAEREYYTRNKAVTNMPISYVNVDNNICYGYQTIQGVPGGVMYNPSGNTPESVIQSQQDSSEGSAVVGQVDSKLHYPSNYLGRRVPVERQLEEESNLTDLVVATNGAVVKLTSSDVFDFYTFGVFDLYSTLNGIESIPSDSFELVNISGLKVRVPKLRETIIPGPEGVPEEEWERYTTYMLDDIVYSSNGAYRASINNTAWTRVVDIEDNVYNHDCPLYFIVLLGATLQGEEPNQTTSYTIITNRGQIYDQYDDHGHQINVLDITQPNTTIDLSCPTRAFTFDCISPVAITTQGHGYYGDNCMIKNGTIIIPQITEIVNSDTDIGSITFDDGALINYTLPTMPYSDVTYEPYSLSQTIRYNVVGAIPAVEQVDLTLTLGVD